MVKYLSCCIFIVLLIVKYEKLNAAHIIGGEMFYECLGYSNGGKDSTSRSYLITIKLYRDCSTTAGAAFDNPLGFSIYKKKTSGNGYDIVNAARNAPEYSVNLIGPNTISPPVYPCLILPPNICVQEGRYVITVDLPIISTEYVLVWQRCCRNNTITNIQSPEATGATFTISIHPESQKTCNSSPQFKSFPPTVVCNNNPLNFDHSAIDKEGDLLIYEFCEPLAGGSRNGNGCNAVSPSPDCPPPFSPVLFKTPTYTYNSPLGGNPKISIDNITGLITGEPNTLGQFVVGVCVSEYRSGVLLSKLRRDFQFNVADCQGTVVATIGNGTLVSKKNYDFLLCGSSELLLNNTSYNRSFINDITWTYENGGKVDTSKLWNPQINFKEGGIHQGQMVLNPGTNCSDTVQFKINVVPDLNSKFEVQFDTCKAGPVSFTSLASSTNSKIIDHNWALGDGYTAFTTDPIINYYRPGTYAIQYTVKDNFGCISRNTKNLQWYPAPNVVVFEPTVREGCVPLSVDFKNISFPTDNSYKFKWVFSDSIIESGYNIKHTFNDTGSYDLSLQVTSPFGCFKEGNFKDIVRVYNPPKAEWLISKTLINIKNPEISLLDISKNTIGRTWILNGLDHYFDRDLTFDYKDTGTYSIRMIANDRFLCTDTLDEVITVYRDFSLFMPNAFSPNGDGKNEEFGPKGQIHSLERYTLVIYDRWGGKVFTATSPNTAWNGRFNNSGPDLPPGVYTYQLEYKVRKKEVYKEQKFVTLLR